MIVTPLEQLEQVPESHLYDDHPLPAEQKAVAFPLQIDEFTNGEPSMVDTVPTEGENAPKPRIPKQKTMLDQRDSVAMYLQEIGKTPLLTKEQEGVLGKQIREGKPHLGRWVVDLMATSFGMPAMFEADQKDPAKAIEYLNARQTFIKSNLRLVVSIAKRYHRQGEGFELLDLIQEGNLGLEHAVEMFDERKGFKFSTYATWWIKQAIGRSLMNKAHMIRLPSKAYSDAMEYRKQAEEFEEAGVTFDDKQMADALGWTVEKVRKVAVNSVMTNSTPSLNNPLDDSANPNELQDIIADPDAINEYENSDVSQVIKALVSAIREHLTDDECTMILMKYGIGYEQPYTAEMIQKAFNIRTRQTITERLKRIMFKLQHPSVLSDIGEIGQLFGADGRIAWLGKAACSDMKAGGFFPNITGRRSKDESKDKVTKSKAMCACKVCPVKDECYKYAQEIQPTRGIWAGQLITKKNPLR